MKPFCFVLMPFGEKPDETGRIIDFDAVYKDVIEPAVRAADMEPIRADEEKAGGIIHKAMYERLMLCDYAIADLTTANANVLYELGIRHGIRPHSTIMMFGEGTRLPFDVAPLRAIPYQIDSQGNPENANTIIAALSEKLNQARAPETDSPLFQLVTNWQVPEVARLKTDSFRELVEYCETVKAELAAARNTSNVDKIDEIQGRQSLSDMDPSIIVDLLLSYRALKEWDKMIALVEAAPDYVAGTVMLQEQYAFALNRDKKCKEAETVLLQVIERHGPSSETNGILGRVYKDMWEDAKKKGQTFLAQGMLRKSIDTYLRGFEADWRDAYPGINAVTLMEMEDPVSDKQAELLPVVLYAVQRRLNTKAHDYWDHATLLELSVLNRDKLKAMASLGNCLAVVREIWEPETTARNLSLIMNARRNRGEDCDWIEDIVKILLEHMV